MPKYYVKCLDIGAVVTAKDELDACVIACEKLNVTTVGLIWAVSEQGFEEHDNDVYIPDIRIMDEFRKRHNY